MIKNYIYVLIAVILIGAVAWLVYGQLAGDTVEKSESVTPLSYQEKAEQKPDSTDTIVTDSSATGSCKRTFNNSNLKTVNMTSNDKIVTLSVAGFGDIKIKVDPVSAPKTSENFIKLAKSGFYDCLTFHRIASGFVIQGGDPEGTGSGGPGYTIPAEIKLPHKKGSIAMARLGDQMNPEKASSGSQFYIALEALPMLDGQYTVFGEVISGMDIVEKIGMVPTITGGPDGPPNQKIEITKAVVSAE